MSTYVHFACIDHDPPLIARDESGQHNEVEIMREMLSERDRWIDLVNDERITIDSRYARNSAWFFRDHPSCRLACRDEYGVWTDLGMGLPSGVTSAVAQAADERQEDA